MAFYIVSIGPGVPSALMPRLPRHVRTSFSHLEVAVCFAAHSLMHQVTIDVLQAELDGQLLIAILSDATLVAYSLVRCPVT
jgi:hypothetical protein